MKRNPYQIELPDDYVWKVLGHLHDDLSRIFSMEKDERLISIIRNRNASSYLDFSEDHSLRSINMGGYDHAKALVYNQYASLLKKYPFDIKGIDRRKAALDKFFVTERFIGNFDYSRLSTSHKHVLDNVRNTISSVLGPLKSGLSDIIRQARFGPGASLGIADGEVSSYYKYESFPYTCTQAALNLAYLSYKDDERWRESVEKRIFQKRSLGRPNLTVKVNDLLKVVEGNKITTVPKTSLVDRTIAIEPLMNVFLQLGVDAYLKPRLKSILGVDLLDQHRNRCLAKSLNNATIDLASASDSISRKLVTYVLPGDWREFLKALSSPYGLVDGVTIKYNKLSSMGNGFTFVLESLIFSAIVISVVGIRTFKESCAVYGDDIIVPTKYSDTVIDTLQLFGFQVNTNKSFTAGPVRESCGVDYFNSRDIRPVFIKKKPSNVKELFSDHNRILRKLYLVSSEFKHATTAYILGLIPRSKRVYGPCSDDEFDTYLHCPNGTVYRHGGWYFKRIVQTAVESRGLKDLDFQKLMHNLAFTSTESGSRFRVHTRRGMQFSMSTSRSDIWNDRYASQSHLSSLAFE